jgi:predicted DNA binding CopG/RHH family protein
MKNQTLKKIPKFKNDDEEAKFWDTHNLTEYFDMSKAQFVSFPNLKFSTQTISLRLPQSLLDRIKVQANKRDVPYQSFIKMLLAERLDEMR